MLIGLLVCGIVEDYSISLIKSIEQMSEKDDVRCVILPIKFLGLDYEKELKNKYAYSYNSSVAYSLLSCFDGLIVEMASVLMYADDATKQRYAALFEKIPHVFISFDQDNVSSVSIDNQAGLMEALEYMHSNGARKFAMLGGTPNNIDAMVRKACFETFLREHALPYGEAAYRDGNFFLPCDEDAEQLVIDNPDADVFVCANDFLAKHIYKALRKYGKRPGKDVSVLGFDDSLICTATYPAISSIRTDILEVGKASYELLMEAIAKRDAGKVKIPSKFILRDSVCHREQGKKSAQVNIGFENFVLPNIANANKEQIESIRIAFEGVSSLMQHKDNIPLDELLAQLYLKLDDLFSCDDLDCLDWERLSDVINARYSRWLRELSDPEDQQKVTDLFIKFHEFVMMANHYTSPEKMFANYTKNKGMERFLRETMQFVRNAEANYTRYIKNIEFLGIKNAYLYLYDEPIYYIQGEMLEIPEHLNLKAVLRDGHAIAIDQKHQKIRRDQLFANEYVNWNGYSRLMLFPVSSDNMLYGVLMCDIRRSGFEQADLFVNQIGSGIRMMNLRIENRRIMDNYEESVRKLKEHNITLDNMNKTDSLTGLNNRRGFFIRANAMLESFLNDNMAVMIGYVDMNDLKLVNDRFGHDDGDFALKTIGRTIADFVTDHNGFGARIGGDEFAYIIMVPRDSAPDRFKNELYDMFDRFNQTSAKPYKVEVSIGDFLLERGSSVTLEEALHQADERLYYEKSVRKKNSILKALN